MAVTTIDVGDWVLCPACHTSAYRKRFVRDLHVCAGCGRHAPLGAEERLALLADPGGPFDRLDGSDRLDRTDRIDRTDAPDRVDQPDRPGPPGGRDPSRGPTGHDDPLGFVDTLPYTTRLARARSSTGLDEAVVCARVHIEGRPVVVAAMDFRFLGGSLGMAVGDRIVQAAEVARTERIPLVVVTASGGARMQEGALSLMQMARTSAAWAQLDEAGVLTVTVVADPTYGGVAASFATLSDVVVAEPGARLGFAGRRVIEQTIRQELPPGFQTAEQLVEGGFIDVVVPRDHLRATLGRLVRAGTAGSSDAPGLAGAPGTRGPAGLTGPTRIDRPRLRSWTGPGRPRSAAASPVIDDVELVPTVDPWETVQAARRLDRPTALEYLAHGFDDFLELRGDRVAGDCSAIVGGPAWLDGTPVMVVGHQKGHDVAELGRRNFGMARPAGYRKAARLMRLADKLGLPVVTLVDTPGAYPGRDAEEQGQAVAIAENLRLMASLRVPVVTVVIGEGGSGGALALAVADRVLMFSHGVYSVISPEGCASIIWKTPTEAPRAAAALCLTARDLLRHGVVDGVIPEPEGGTGAAPAVAADRLAAAVTHTLQALRPVPPGRLVADRRRRFGRFGRSLDIAAPPADDHPHLAPVAVPAAGNEPACSTRS